MKSGYQDFFNKVKKNKNIAPPKRVQQASARTRRAQTAQRNQPTPTEEVIRQKLGVRKKRKKPPFPWRMVSLSGFGFAICLYLATHPDLESILRSPIEIGIFGQAVAQGDTPRGGEKKSQSPGESEEKSAASASETSVSDVRNWSDEELSFFTQLKQRKNELDQREERLKKLEEELQKKQLELDEKLTQLDKMRTEIATTLKDRVDDDSEKVKKLVQVYSNMKPQNAAQVISSLDQDLAIAVLGQMKKQEAAAILNYVEPKKAREISEVFAGYRRD